MPGTDTTAYCTPPSAPTTSDLSIFCVLPHTSVSLFTSSLGGAGAVPLYFTVPLIDPPLATAPPSYARSGAAQPRAAITPRIRAAREAARHTVFSFIACPPLVWSQTRRNARRPSH